VLAESIESTGKPLGDRDTAPHIAGKLLPTSPTDWKDSLSLLARLSSFGSLSGAFCPTYAHVHKGN